MKGLVPADEELEEATTEGEEEEEKEKADAAGVGLKLKSKATSKLVECTAREGEATGGTRVAEGCQLKSNPVLNEASGSENNHSAETRVPSRSILGGTKGCASRLGCLLRRVYAAPASEARNCSPSSVSSQRSMFACMSWSGSPRGGREDGKRGEMGVAKSKYLADSQSCKNKRRVGRPREGEEEEGARKERNGR